MHQFGLEEEPLGGSLGSEWGGHGLASFLYSPGDVPSSACVHLGPVEMLPAFSSSLQLPHDSDDGGVVAL